MTNHNSTCSRAWPSFLYDFIKCEGDAELEQTIQTINENGYNLVSVTQKDDTYKVFFRRFWP